MVTTEGIRPPLDEVKITQGYRLFHPAIDFDGLTGDPVYPIKNQFMPICQKLK
jgi:hypothetical protein